MLYYNSLHLYLSIYRIEGANHGRDLSSLRLPRESTLCVGEYDDAPFEGVVAFEAAAIRETPTASLYQETMPQAEPVTLRASPYYARSSRGENEMRVFIRA